MKESIMGQLYHGNASDNSGSTVLIAQRTAIVVVTLPYKICPITFPSSQMNISYYQLTRLNTWSIFECAWVSENYAHLLFSKQFFWKPRLNFYFCIFLTKLVSVL